MSIARSSTSIIAGLSLLVLAGCRDAPASPPPVLRVALEQPAELDIGGGAGYEFGLTLAADGRQVAFPAFDSRTSRSAIWLHDLRTGNFSEVPGTNAEGPTNAEGANAEADTQAVLPFWAPSGRTIGYFAAGKMHAADIGGTTHVLADAPSPRGAAWLSNGDIVFAPSADAGLFRRRADGAVTQLTTLAPGEVSHRLPQPLGDTHILFYVRATESARQGVWIAPLDQPAMRKRLANSEAHAVAVGDAIVYSNGGALVIQRVDPQTLSFSGKPELLATSVGHSAEHALYATATSDLVIHGEPASGLRELRWFNAEGAIIGRIGEPMRASDVRLSPIASAVAVARVDPQLKTLDIWRYDDTRPVPRRVSPSINVDESPAWSRDGRRVGWVSGRNTVVIRDAAAASPETSVRKLERAVRVSDWPSNELIVLSEMQGAQSDIVLFDTRAGTLREYAKSPFNETFGSVSPNGRWLAYVSDESGEAEIYVDSFPTPRRRARVTMGGGNEPRWSRDGAHIYFRRASELHAARVDASGDSLEAVSTTRVVDAGDDIRSFDVSADGRFLVNVPAAEARRSLLQIMVNPRTLLPSAP